MDQPDFPDLKLLQFGVTGAVLNEAFERLGLELAPFVQVAGLDPESVPGFANLVVSAATHTLLMAHIATLMRAKADEFAYIAASLRTAATTVESLSAACASGASSATTPTSPPTAAWVDALIPFLPPTDARPN